MAFWAAVLSGVALLCWRRTPRVLAALWVVGVLIASYSAAALWHAARQRRVAIVIEPDATARLEAADRAGVAESLPGGSGVRVLSEHGAWVYCELPGRGRGWLPRRSLERVAPNA